MNSADCIMYHQGVEGIIQAVECGRTETPAEDERGCDFLANAWCRYSQPALA